MLILMGQLRVDPSECAAFLADVDVIAPLVRGENGCLFYSLAPEDAASGRLLLAQRWQDQAALAAHLSAPSTVAFQDKWMKKLTLDVQQYEVASAAVALG